MPDLPSNSPGSAVQSDFYRRHGPVMHSCPAGATTGGCVGSHTPLVHLRQCGMPRRCQTAANGAGVPRRAKTSEPIQKSVHGAPPWPSAKTTSETLWKNREGPVVGQRAKESHCPYRVGRIGIVICNGVPRNTRPGRFGSAGALVHERPQRRRCLAPTGAGQRRACVPQCRKYRWIVTSHLQRLKCFVPGDQRSALRSCAGSNSRRSRHAPFHTSRDAERAGDDRAESFLPVPFLLCISPSRLLHVFGRERRLRRRTNAFTSSCSANACRTTDLNPRLRRMNLRS